MLAHNVESRVIKASIESVWATLKTQDFGFWTLVKSTESAFSAAEVGSTRTVTFTDGAVQVYRLVEFSELNNSLTYEIIESEPAMRVLSATHRIRAFPVSADNTTFVQWTSEFASEGASETVQDSKYKKLEALADLAKALEN
ncbi:hypothetical protein BX661DRAFT_188773 [Kickxella alabastrina]|uniref:uncharacterized protein n=1 Tax=Kickxella alabastrina TaxID=61397 RepID=UPI00221F7137|nr:uncharacterized protein BX661DRAFT_188773 [Kickxella alabastrina]KAI7820906.1 hypothetical protein BX661DRAFT_188773 [Kickxella alabastrina]KAJ1939990.1 hypothetical protein GGF37_004170 [Kickxella alabastrina]